VFDGVAYQFLVIFYAQFNNGKSAADALRVAKLKMLRDGWAPYFWAPYILIGDRGDKERGGRTVRH
jgi:CHAT domain-containing protein